MTTTTSSTTTAPAAGPPIEANRPSSKPGPVAALPAGPNFAATALENRLRLFGDASRAATLLLGIASGAVAGLVNARFLTVAGALLMYAALQRAYPLDLTPPRNRAGVRVGLELVLVAVGVLATGGAQSPFVLTPMTSLVLAGYVWGDDLVFGAAVSAALAVSLATAMNMTGGDSGSVAELGLVFLLCGMLGAFGRSLLRAVEEQQAAALDQATQMATANELLISLHALAQTLPASLDLGEVMSSARSRLRTLLPYTALTILVRDDSGDGWTVELAEGSRLPDRLALDALPPALLRASSSGRPLIVDDALTAGEKGCAPLTRSGMYAALRARGSVVGLLAIEHQEPSTYRQPDAELVGNASAVIGLAIDNAKWFGRLRLFGAEAERARIARDLHDRIAQSLAYVAFELERLRDIDAEYHNELDSLHDVVRSVVTGLRETLYQLRAGVTEDEDLEHAASEYLTRFAERTGVEVHWRHSVQQRLPMPIEQEVWRILQEAITNVERHADARNAYITWDVRNGSAFLEVRDDGRGFEPAGIGRDHYGLVGIRERADAMRARVTINSQPGNGTTVSLRVEAQR
jgi:signal transduction histidine kinase